MEVGSIILGWPWLFDNEVTIYGRTNFYSFTHQGKKIMINPSPPKATNRKIGDGPKENLKKKSLHLIDAKELETTMSKGSPIWMLAVREVREDPRIDYPKKVASLLCEFHDIFLEDLLDYLPPMRNIQHVIDLVPRSILSNLPHYRLNPTEHIELQR